MTTKQAKVNGNLEGHKEKLSKKGISVENQRVYFFYNDRAYKLVENTDYIVKLIGEEITVNCKAIRKRIDDVQF